MHICSWANLVSSSIFSLGLALLCLYGSGWMAVTTFRDLKSDRPLTNGDDPLCGIVWTIIVGTFGFCIIPTPAAPYDDWALLTRLIIGVPTILIAVVRTARAPDPRPAASPSS